LPGSWAEVNLEMRSVAEMDRILPSPGENLLCFVIGCASRVDQVKENKIAVPALFFLSFSGFHLFFIFPLQGFYP
jgi:hypothetical protein